MDTNKKGDLAILKVAAELVEYGYSVFLPTGEHCEFDLVLRINRKFIGLQVKYITMRNGIINLKLYTMARAKNNSVRYNYYNNEIDMYVIYCPDTNQCYYVKGDMLTSHNFALRLVAPKNNQIKKINLAENFIIDKLEKYFE